jgi:hypothetical protein
MKINFSKAALTDLDGNTILNAAGEPQLTDYKHLANAIFIASSDQVGLSNLDKLEIATKINKGEEIDLEEREQELLKEFINCMSGTNGVHAAAWLKLFDKSKKS